MLQEWTLSFLYDTKFQMHTFKSMPHHQSIPRPCALPRYSREEPFTALNIEIRNQQNLIESLEQYVKGDLLEGANAYHCEKCNKKVSAIWCRCVNYPRRVSHSSIVRTNFVRCGEWHHGDLVLCLLHFFL